MVDLAVPASTNPKSIASQLKKYRNHDGLVVVFSTYQSIDAVSEAQQEILSETNGEYGVFDFIICDEAHRTTGVKLSDKDESNFTKIHSDDNVKGRKRLYMTAGKSTACCPLSPNSVDPRCHLTIDPCDQDKNNPCQL